MIEQAAFVLMLTAFGGLRVSVEAVEGISACHRAYKVVTGRMTAGSIGFEVLEPCPPDPDAPVSEELAISGSDGP